MLPKPDILNSYSHGKFVLSNLAAKRAKQLKEGAPPLVQVDSAHPLTIALAEIAAGKIKPILNRNAEAIEIPDVPTLMVDETMPAELGMLLPALDESEAALVTTAVLEGEDAEGDLEGDDLISLSDLVDEEEEEVVAGGDDDTLSLSDIAEAESVGEEGEEE